MRCGTNTQREFSFPNFNFYVCKVTKMGSNVNVSTGAVVGNLSKLNRKRADGERDDENEDADPTDDHTKVIKF